MASAISENSWMGRLEEMWEQLEHSWPKTMESILASYKHGGEDFYIYTFFKWDLRLIPATYNVYHQPRISRPDAFPGTVLRLVSPKRGISQIIWALPHQEGFKMYESGKVFEDPIVQKSVERYLKGDLDKWTEGKIDEFFEKV
jgi:hypothetical protein